MTNGATRGPVDVLKDAFLHVSKWCGLFRLSRHLTRGGLRILCYHGFAAGDEVEFRPGLFVTTSTFDARLRTLRSGKYPVVTLQAGLEALEAGMLPDAATVITIDDVFYGVCTQAVPLLQHFGMCATAYVTTYYCVKESPVFRLVVQYMLWKTERQSLDLRELDASLAGTVQLDGAQARQRTALDIISVGDCLPNESARVALMKKLGAVLGVDYDALAAARTFNVVTIDEARSLVRNGMDLQLHTHRHRLPEEENQVRREIDDNRRVLEPIAGSRLEHLCYPSGVWSPRLWPWLESAGVVSATTCDPGLNYRGGPRLGLKRFLDSEDLSQIHFEAEISGFKELLRRVRSHLAP